MKFDKMFFFVMLFLICLVSSALVVLFLVLPTNVFFHMGLIHHSPPQYLKFSIAQTDTGPQYLPNMYSDAGDFVFNEDKSEFETTLNYDFNEEVILTELTLTPETQSGKPHCWLDLSKIPSESRWVEPAAVHLGNMAESEGSSERKSVYLVLSCSEFKSEDVVQGKWLVSYSFHFLKRSLGGTPGSETLMPSEKYTGAGELVVDKPGMEEYVQRVDEYYSTLRQQSQWRFNVLNMSFLVICFAIMGYSLYQIVKLKTSRVNEPRHQETK